MRSSDRLGKSGELNDVTRPDLIELQRAAQIAANQNPLRHILAAIEIGHQRSARPQQRPQQIDTEELGIEQFSTKHAGCDAHLRAVPSALSVARVMLRIALAI